MSVKVYGLHCEFFLNPFQGVFVSLIGLMGHGK